MLKTRQARRNTAEMSKMLIERLALHKKHNDILTTLTKGKSNGSDGTWDIFWTQTIPLEKKERERSQICTCWIENGLDVSFSCYCSSARQTYSTQATLLHQNMTKTDTQNALGCKFLTVNKCQSFNECMTHLHIHPLLQNGDQIQPSAKVRIH